MKKLLILIVLILFCFAGCSKNKKLNIENNNWTISIVQSDNGEVVACSQKNESLYKELYSDIVILDMMCEAKDGNVIITDKTNNQKYEGIYEKIENDLNSTIYKIIIGEKEGSAIVSKTKHENDEEVLTLIININNYNLNFTLN